MAQKLDIKSQTTHSCSTNEWDRFVAAYYDKQERVYYSIVPDQLMSNGDIFSGEVHKRELYSEEKNELSLWKRLGKVGSITATIMQDLVNNDAIPEGKYYIEAWW